MTVDPQDLSSDDVQLIGEHNRHHRHACPTSAVLDLTLPLWLATKSLRGWIEVDFCTCQPGDLSVYLCEWQGCFECEALRSHLDDDEAADCLGYWGRTNGESVTRDELESRIRQALT